MPPRLGADVELGENRPSGMTGTRNVTLAGQDAQPLLDLQAAPVRKLHVQRDG